MYTKGICPQSAVVSAVSSVLHINPRSIKSKSLQLKRCKRCGWEYMRNLCDTGWNDGEAWYHYFNKNRCCTQACWMLLWLWLEIDNWIIFCNTTGAERIFACSVSSVHLSLPLLSLSWEPKTSWKTKSQPELRTCAKGELLFSGFFPAVSFFGRFTRSKHNSMSLHGLEAALVWHPCKPKTLQCPRMQDTESLHGLMSSSRQSCNKSIRIIITRIYCSRWRYITTALSLHTEIPSRFIYNKCFGF